MRAQGLLPAIFLVAFATPQLSAVQAQERMSPAFRKVFPAPTGRNGYEEILLAADLARAAEARKSLLNASLSEMRMALRHPQRRRAMELLRVGLRKPITFPRRDAFSGASPSETARLRSLGRLLAANIRVAFADGRITDAVGHLHTGLRLGNALHGDTFVVSLVAVATERIVIHTFAEHLSQLTPKDCEQLQRLIQSVQRWPDPTARILDAERRHALAMLGAVPGQEAGLEQMPSPFSEVLGVAGGVAFSALMHRISQAAFEKQFTLQVDALYRRLIAEAAKPLLQRRPVSAIVAEGSPGGEFLAVFAEPVQDLLRTVAAGRTRRQLLGVHAAIRRYQWEHGRLPKSLNDLRIGDLTVDPFTGKSLEYRVTGPRTYEVYSVGPEREEGRQRIDIMASTAPSPQPQ